MPVVGKNMASKIHQDSWCLGASTVTGLATPPGPVSSAQGTAHEQPIIATVKAPAPSMSDVLSPPVLMRVIRKAAKASVSLPASLHHAV